MKLSSSKFLKWTLGVGITLLLSLFYIVSTQLVLDKPEYDDFCENPQVRIVPQTQDECVAIGGQWTEDQFLQKGYPREAPPRVPSIELETRGYCNEDFTCREEYSVARIDYESNFFVTLVVLGTLTLIASFMIRSIAVVAPAISSAGVLTLFIASVRYWSEMNEYLRVAVLAVALIALIWVGVKKFKPEENTDAEIRS